MGSGPSPLHLQRSAPAKADWQTSCHSRDHEEPRKNIGEATHPNSPCSFSVIANMYSMQSQALGKEALAEAGKYTLFFHNKWEFALRAIWRIHFWGLSVILEENSGELHGLTCRTLAVLRDAPELQLHLVLLRRNWKYTQLSVLASWLSHQTHRPVPILFLTEWPCCCAPGWSIT